MYSMTDTRGMENGFDFNNSHELLSCLANGMRHKSCNLLLGVVLRHATECSKNPIKWTETKLHDFTQCAQCTHSETH